MNLRRMQCSHWSIFTASRDHRPSELTNLHGSKVSKRTLSLSGEAFRGASK
jgi:hypothetical protein